MKSDFKYNKEELKELVKAYMEAKALYDTIHEAEIECDKRVLESRIFYEDEKWSEMFAKRQGTYTRKRILNPDDSYLMNEQDAQEYYTLIYEEYKKEGIEHPKGRCYIPSSIPRDILNKTEDLLIDYAIDVAPEELKDGLRFGKRHWKYRDQIIDLVLKLDCGAIEKQDFADIF